jgi:hypothetical protein
MMDRPAREGEGPSPDGCWGPVGNQASEGFCNRCSVPRRGAARFGGKAGGLPDGRRNATTMFHRFSAFDHLPVAINVFIQHLLIAG